MTRSGLLGCLRIGPAIAVLFAGFRPDTAARRAGGKLNHDLRRSITRPQDRFRARRGRVLGRDRDEGVLALRRTVIRSTSLTGRLYAPGGRGRDRNKASDRGHIKSVARRVPNVKLSLTMILVRNENQITQKRSAPGYPSAVLSQMETSR